ncbi:hypothetical protein ACFQ8Q_23380 [Streptomyces cyaneofuscatus]|uniref:hypothetical protein n=1 Tax=Streptomyces cyaneofuscatus TaxID=66883 RepID=UPI0036AD925E
MKPMPNPVPVPDGADEWVATFGRVVTGGHLPGGDAGQHGRAPRVPHRGERIAGTGSRRPTFQALTSKGNLVPRDLATKRGEKLKPGAINGRVQVLADRAGIPYITGRPLSAGRSAHRPGAGARAVG